MSARDRHRRRNRGAAGGVLRADAHGGPTARLNCGRGWRHRTVARVSRCVRGNAATTVRCVDSPSLHRAQRVTTCGPAVSARTSVNGCPDGGVHLGVPVKLGVGERHALEVVEGGDVLPVVVGGPEGREPLEGRLVRTTTRPDPVDLRPTAARRTPAAHPTPRRYGRRRTRAVWQGLMRTLKTPPAAATPTVPAEPGPRSIAVRVGPGLLVVAESLRSRAIE
jgi:hypothetical protein